MRCSPLVHRAVQRNDVGALVVLMTALATVMRISVVGIFDGMASLCKSILRRWTRCLFALRGIIGIGD